MMTMNEFRSLFHTGLIKQNTGLVQLLGLCPLLAISNNVVNALSLGLATVLVMAASSGAVSGVRHFVPHEIRIPVFVLIIAALVTVIDLAMNAFVHPLYLVLGIFIPLITTNCIVLARVDAFSSKNHPLHSVIDALAMGLGLTLVLVILGAIREIAGKGTLFSGIDLVFGDEGLRVGLVKMFLDPFHQKESGGAFDHETTTSNMRMFFRLGLAKTRARGDDLIIITTLYGPPAFMTLQNILRGRDLDPARKTDLADYLISWAKFLQEKEKFPIKYISLHNEGEDWERWPWDGKEGNIGAIK